MSERKGKSAKEEEAEEVKESARFPHKSQL
jgi:hypothetical protein